MQHHAGATICGKMCEIIQDLIVCSHIIPIFVAMCHMIPCDHDDDDVKAIVCVCTFAMLFHKMSGLVCGGMQLARFHIIIAFTYFVSAGHFAYMFIVIVT